MKKQLGFLIVLTSAFLSGVPLPASAGNIYDIATTCTWKFGRTDGSVIANAIKLTPTGRVTGYSNPNEFSWAIEDGNLIFRAQDGQVSTRFTSVSLDPTTGQIILRGAFLLNPSSNITHTLNCRN